MNLKSTIDRAIDAVWSQTKGRALGAQSEREGRALDREIAAEAALRGWTPAQVQAEVDREYAAKDPTQPKEYHVRRDRDAQPTEQGREYWAAAPPARAERKADGHRATMLAESGTVQEDGRVLRAGQHYDPGRAARMTAADIWREQIAPGPGRARQVGQPHPVRSLARQGFRTHDCGHDVRQDQQSGQLLDARGSHDCRDMPGYVDAMHEDALAENARRDSQRPAAGHSGAEQAAGQPRGVPDPPQQDPGHASGRTADPGDSRSTGEALRPGAHRSADGGLVIEGTEPVNISGDIVGSRSSQTRAGRPADLRATGPSAPSTGIVSISASNVTVSGTIAGQQFTHTDYWPGHSPAAEPAGPDREAE